MNNVFLSVGSNINPEENITSIVDLLLNSNWFNNICVSENFHSKPVGFESSNDFINIVIYGKTPLNPQQLLLNTQKIENNLNRIRCNSGNYIDRTADIDIIFFNDRIISSEKLTIPHPHWNKRDFVLSPLIQLIKTHNLEKENRWLKDII